MSSSPAPADLGPGTDPIEVTPILSTTASDPSQSSPVAVKPLCIRVLGVGGAGGNAISHMATTDLRGLGLAALHTSARILEMTTAPEKVLLGKELTHGLGAGGDPSLARAAAERDTSLLKNLCQDVDLLFIVTGLGGGTGTGVAPVLARLAKEAGALVLGVATMPFEIEGVRRRHHAEQGLQELKAAADAVICLPNQKIFRIVDENTTVLESLKMANELLSQGIRGIWQMLTLPSLIHVEFGDLCNLLRDRHVESSFATAQAQGEGRAREVIEQLMGSPLLEGGHALGEAESVLVNVVGGPDLSMADVKRIMEEVNRRCDNAHLVMGASIANDFQGRIGLTLLVARRVQGTAHPEERIADGARAATPSDPAEPTHETESRFLSTDSPERASSRFVPPPPQLTPEKTQELAGRKGHSRSGKSGFRFQQTHLPLEIVSKGRFEKSQPTIHRGEDLDVPTYIRRGIPLN